MKRLFALLPLIVCALMLGAAPQASALLDRCAAKIKSAPSLYVNYTATADGHTADGQLVIQGDMFTVTGPGMRSWYDGKTQWTYSSQIGEVNIITPTPEEVRQINPLAIIKTFSDGYTAKTVKTAGNLTTIQLTAKDPKADIRSADVTINDTSLYPTSIVLNMSNNQKVTLAVRNITPGTRLPVSSFRFERSMLPGVNVVDLR